MDHVLGTDHVGGWLHRLQHGHDLSAVAHMWWEHGFGGGAQALYHVYGRDFFTPHGIPILPAETDRASPGHFFCVSRADLTPRASSSAGPFAQKCRNMMRGCSCVM